MSSKNISLSEPEEREILKTLEMLGRSYDISQVFRDFLDLSICSFALGFMEEEYLHIAKRYNSKDLKEFSKVLGLLLVYFGKVEKWADPMGVIYENLAGKYKRSGLGQFFTPPAICDLMAKQTPCEVEAPKILDPSCGSSRLLLAYHAEWKNIKATYYGIDRDKICAQMSALNMLFHGMHGFIIHGNTLSLETFSGYEVNWKINVLGLPHIRPMKKEACKALLFEAKETIKEKEKPPDVPQLLLDF